jgi:hypothetical protein
VQRAHRAPIEYGDNFPVPSGSWSPTIPWRFPKHEERFRSSSWFGRILPWMMLGLGMGLGILWMSWRVEPPSPGLSGSLSEPSPAVEGSTHSPVPVEGIPKSRPIRGRSRVA